MRAKEVEELIMKPGRFIVHGAPSGFSRHNKEEEMLSPIFLLLLANLIETFTLLG
jgi:hypothetical protein